MPNTPNGLQPPAERDPVPAHSPTIALGIGNVYLGPRDPGRRVYRARFVRAGRIRTADNRPGHIEIPAEAIQDALDRGLFDALPVGVDHPSLWEGPQIARLAGVTASAGWNGDTESSDGEIRLYDNQHGKAMAALFDQILADQEDGEPTPDVGLSLVFWAQWKPRDNSDDPLRLKRFRHIEGIDFVLQPAADGRVLEALSALAPRKLPIPPIDSNPLPGIQAGLLPLELDAVDQVDETGPNAEPWYILEPVEASGIVPAGPKHHTEGVAIMPPNEELNVQDPAPDASEAPQPAVDRAPVDRQAETWQASIAQAGTRIILQGSNLPQVSVDRLAAQSYSTPDQLQAAIDAEREYLASLQEDSVVQIGNQPPRGARISLGPTGLEQVQQALESLIEGVRPPTGVQPLTGIRELYHLLSGDYEMTGVFQGERIYLANVTTSTMAGLVANALNKRVINLFMEYPHWWAPIVVEEDFNTLQEVKWITLGGVGELPTVAEGAAYTELTWDDNTETATFYKKGGYLGITLEAIDKDDTRRLRAAPRALAQAAWLTLGKSVSAIFTDNTGTGPTLADSTALFDAGRSNLGTAALTWATYVAARVAMQKMTEVNSSERLGALTAPKYLLVPIDLETSALQILASEGEPGTADNDANPYSEGNVHSARLRSARDRVIVVPLWTDTNNWAAVADPNLYPSIGIGYRYGRTPEIFSVASPTAGLMFTNDTLPVKVRFFFAVGPTDYRGLYKANVS